MAASLLKNTLYNVKLKRTLGNVATISNLVTTY